MPLSIWVCVSILHPDAIVAAGQSTSISEMMLCFLSILNLVSLLQPATVLPCFSILPLFGNVEVCSAHIQVIVCRIQGGAGPEGRDAVH